MNYKIFGNQESHYVLVTLPPLGERKEIYEELANHLPEYKMVAFDLPGHNQVLSDNYSISTFIHHMMKCLDELKVSEAHFIGNSIGGWMIQEVYNLYPEKVSSLLLLDGGFYFLGERENMDESIHLPIIDKLEDLKNAVHETAHSMEGLEEHTYTIFKDYMMDNFVRKDQAYVHHSNEDALNSLSKEIVSTNYCLQTAIHTPLGLLLAETILDDFGKQKLNEFKKKHPHAKVEVIDNGYHFLPITNTKEVAQFIRTFTSLSAIPNVNV
ncbi:alpha/beta fold hydrolase [Ferdinandcohnia sp. Marseille-Q9671]